MMDVFPSSVKSYTLHAANVRNGPKCLLFLLVLWDEKKRSSKNENPAWDDAHMSLDNSFLFLWPESSPSIFYYTFPLAFKRAISELSFVHRICERCYEILHGVNLSACSFKKSYLPRLIVQFANRDVHLVRDENENSRLRPFLI